jgi:hypothetical protein
VASLSTMPDPPRPLLALSQRRAGLATDGPSNRTEETYGFEETADDGETTAGADSAGAPGSEAAEAPSRARGAGGRRLGGHLRGDSRRGRLRAYAGPVGGIAFCLLSLAACVLLARRLSDASWPLAGAHVPLVLVAWGAYLASFGFRAYGWHFLFPSGERPDGPRCLAACGAAAASGLVLPFRLDYVVKISTLRRLGGVRIGLETVALSIVALGMLDAVATLPLAVSALLTSGPVLRAPLIVVILFCLGCLGILALGQRVARLPLVGRSDRLHAVYRRVADVTRLSPRTLLAGLLLLACWTSRALGSTMLLLALGVGFSPTLALVVLCMAGAMSILPITAGGAVAGMGTTAGVLFALGVAKGTAVNFSLASGLLLTSAALIAAALGLAGSLLLTFRARGASAVAIPATVA